MIKSPDRIKELLATENQGFEELLTPTGCLCIEGVFALAWGAKIRRSLGVAIWRRTNILP
jgi:hypothetical protein